MTRLALPQGNIVPRQSAYLEELADAYRIEQIVPPEFIAPEKEQSAKSIAAVAVGLGLGVAAVAGPLVFSVKRASAIELAQAPPMEPSPVATISLVGDSISVGRKGAGTIVEKLNEAGIMTLAADVKGSRPLVLAACDADALSRACTKTDDGIRALDNNRDAIAKSDVIAIYLGTNPSSDIFSDALRNIRHAHEIGASDGKPALIVLGEIFGDSKYADADVRNQILYQVRDAGRAEGIEVEVLPYRDHARGNIEMGDSVHPSSHGYDQLTDYDIQLLTPLVHKKHAELYPSTTPLPVEPIEPTTPEIVSPELPVLIDEDESPIVTPIISPAALSIEDEVFQKYAGKRDLHNEVLARMPAPTLLDITIQPLAPAVTPPLPVPEVVPQLPVIQPTVISIEAPRLEAIIEDKATLPSQPEIVIETVPIVIEEVSSTPARTPEAAVIEAPETEAAIDFRAFYSVNDQNVVDDKALRQFIIDGGAGFYKAPAGDGIPEGYYRIPDSIGGLYTFANHTTDRERLASLDTAVVAVMIADKVHEMSARYPDMGELVLMDALSRHKEHRHGGDIDVGLLANPEARQELFVWLLGLRNEDGSAYIHHIVSGDAGLVERGNEYLDSMGYRRPNILLQADHGDVPSDTAHWHISMDGGQQGPFSLPEAEITLNDQRPINGVDAPIAEPAVPPVVEDEGTNEVAPPLVVPTLLDVQITLTDEEETLPTITDIQEETRDKDREKDKNKANETEEEEVATDPEPEEPENVEEQPVEEAPPETVPPVETPEPTPAEVTAPLRDVFTDELIQNMLPNAPIENIQAYTPLVLNALNEFGIADEQMACYAFATIRVETSGFAPIDEIGKGKGKEYGEPDPETGHIYHGRGLVQITWRTNYVHYGEILGEDLLNHPERANDPPTAARILAVYLKENEGRIRDALNNNDMKAARQVVNGKRAHGLEAFSEAYYTCNHVLSQ